MHCNWDLLFQFHVASTIWLSPLQVVYIYELLCRGEDPSADSPEFWNEFFLLQPNFESLEDQVSKLNNEQLQVVKPNLNTLFQKCIEMLDTSKGRTARLNATCNAQLILTIRSLL